MKEEQSISIFCQNIGPVRQQIEGKMTAFGQEECGILQTQFKRVHMPSTYDVT